MYHADLRREIDYLRALIHFKSRKLQQMVEQESPLSEKEILISEIKQLHEKIRLCIDEAKAQDVQRLQDRGLSPQQTNE